jgi:hypothetical protein
MDYLSGFPSTKNGKYCVFVVIDQFSKMSILAPCKKSIIVEATTRIFFEHFWVHFGLRWTINLDRDIRFLSIFWSNMWSLMDTKLTKSNAFHPQIDGRTKVVNRMILHILCMYNSKNPCTWAENITYVQHSYNIAFHNSLGQNPLHMCLGFHPLVCIDVSLPITSS